MESKDDPKKKTSHTHIASETFKYDSKNHKKGTDMIKSSNTTYSTTINKDGTTTDKVVSVDRTATVDAKGRIGKNVTETTSVYSETRTTNDKDCPQCYAPGTYENYTTEPKTMSYEKAAADDPLLKYDTEQVAKFKDLNGISPLQDVANGNNNFAAKAADVTWLGSMIPGVAGYISWGLNEIFTASSPTSPEDLQIVHDAKTNTMRATGK